MTLSTSKAEVIKIDEAFPIEGADRLLLVQAHDGYPCVVGKEDFVPGNLHIFITPDSLVDPKRKEFKFLEKRANKQGLVRIRTMKLRGQISMGLLIPAPSGAKVGEDYAERLEITHYEPPVKGSAYTQPKLSKTEKWIRIITHRSKKYGSKPPKIHAPHYDVDALRRFRYLYEGKYVIVSEKIHGCVHFQTQIRMAKLNKKRVIEVKKGDYVLGLNKNNEFVASKVLEIHNNGKAEFGWLEINIKKPEGNLYTKKLIVTPNHEIYCPTINQYVKAKYLQKGSEISTYLNILELTSKQKQILLGKILGDGSATFVNNSGFVIWGQKEEIYTDDLIYALNNIASRTTTIISGYSKKPSYRGRTKQTLGIGKFINPFFTTGKKSLISARDLLLQEMTALSLAVWYMDDGSLGHSEKQQDRANFAVCAYTKEEVDVLVEMFWKNWKIIAVPYKTGKYMRIRLNYIDADKLFKLIYRYIPEYMKYKLPEKYRIYKGKLPRSSKAKFINCITSGEITNIKKIAVARSNKYDLTTETGNYFASDILVHNSNMCIAWENKGWIHKLFHWNAEQNLRVRSRTVWQSTEKKSWYTNCITDAMRKFAEANSDYVLFGEVYGPMVQKGFDYGVDKSTFIAFDIWDSFLKYWVGNSLFAWLADSYAIPRVPILYEGIFDFDKIVDLAEGQTTIGGDHVREGVVISVVGENELVRQLKCIGLGYYSKSDTATMPKDMKK